MTVTKSSPPAGISARGRRKAFVGATSGHLIEWYDYGIYGFLAVYMGQAFFSSASPTVALISSFATFALSFFVRPLGGLVFGPLGDRIGRQRTMALVMFLMAGSTFTIGLLPTYETVGFLAPALLIFARCVQGLSAGGEIGTVTTFIAEYAGPKRRGFSTSLLMMTAVLGLMVGSIVANGMTAVFGTEFMQEWGWRIPFLIAGPLGLIAAYIRSKLEDSPEFKALAHSGHTEKQPLKALMSWKRSLLLVAGCITLLASLFYMVLTYVSTYLTTILGFDNTTRFWFVMIAAGTAAVLMPLGGMFTDRFGRKNFLIATSIMAIGSFAWFFFSAPGATPAEFFWPLLACAASLGLYASTPYAVMSDLFPTSVRASGISLAYNIPIAVFGGSAPLIASALISGTGNISSPAWFFITTAVISLIAVCIISPRDYQRVEEANLELKQKIADSQDTPADAQSAFAATEQKQPVVRQRIG